MTHDVIVVGAGLSGLRAARDFRAAGRSVLVIEGGSRPGGRLYRRPSVIDPAVDVEVGGAYFAPRHHKRMAAEIARYGLSTRPAALSRALRRSDRQNGLSIPEHEKAATRAALRTVLRDARRITVGVGLEYQGLDDLDIPAQEYLDALDLTPTTKQWVKAWCRTIVGSDLNTVSALGILMPIAAHQHSVSGAVLSHCAEIVTGTSSLVSAVAGDVDEIRFDGVITALHQHHDGVEVCVGDDEVMTARHVVLATPLNSWRGIDFDPALPARRAQVVMDSRGCRCVRLHIHARNVPGGLFRFGDDAIPVLFDAGADSGGGRILTGYADGTAIDPRSLEQVRAAVRSALPDAEIVGVDYHDWSADPLYRGSGTHARVGQPTIMHERLCADHGRIHFAGSDVALNYPGYMEGALEAAERAVEAVLASKSPPPPPSAAPVQR
ncbi:flavin monoamine oxidase family protein [Rhodococcus sp. NPDC057014]|uniref:flavin monoamine oxidase family protein n=1 Tax=Rhodococcus sp. NPDC057014 TaxID=3346000 RepID=UPI0036277DE7